MSTNFDDPWTQEIDAGTMGGRRLPSFTGRRDGVAFTVRTLQPASDDLLALARRNLAELADEDLERLEPRRFRHRESGELWVVPHGHTSLYDDTTAQAFVVRDELIVPLCRAEQEPQGQTRSLGEMRERKQ